MGSSMHLELDPWVLRLLIDASRGEHVIMSSSSSDENKNLNLSKPSEDPPIRGGNYQDV